ncbi:glycosyltransferase [Sinorhizobium numidicum]|uniref:Glycosyltransferase n=1 Tax=Sinorhizobium numidicum TaxID=680248 RepID=A0ABY8D394_9HYPH|nr:glycosyltransferase [Sinorhizobium numidicum]WEX77492.1 glycosyltransferase [Sinorhizobium numidicum]WEX84152.1 glycosyltransferase [Sinorhizobium numidicum]
MRFLFYTHSLVSDWNHGNAHFLRGVMRELLRAGHEATALEPSDSWSRLNLLEDQGVGPIVGFRKHFPELRFEVYDADFDHEAAVNDTDVVILHEWTEPALVARLGRARRDGGRFTLAFHDTHHRAITAEAEIARLDLSHYDFVLAFGEALRQRYLRSGWGRHVYTWHEAADAALFHPMPEVEKTGDLVWIGNWGDDERSAEIASFLIEPARKLKLKTTVRGVRYPVAALAALRKAGIVYGGWLANAAVPRVFAECRATVHIPRRPYVEALPGIPTIRVFEALACGIPLISAPWTDAEGLFRPGKDFLFARDGEEMTRLLRKVLSDAAFAEEMVASGLETIRARHTCRHRVDELLDIVAAYRPGGAKRKPTILKEAAV